MNVMPERLAAPVLRSGATSGFRSVRRAGLNLALIRRSAVRRRSAVPLTQTQLVAAVAERADLTKADAKRALAALDDVGARRDRERPEGADRRAGSAHPAGEAGHQEAPGPQPGDR